MKNSWNVFDFLSFLCITIVLLIFFLPLFYPEPQLIVTPDFVRSDSFHSSFATKYLLSDALKASSLPLWSSKLGLGFPVFAEGQIGYFFLPNLLLFRFFDPVGAYNAALVFAVFTFAIGTYVFLRLLNITRAASLFGAITAGLSGPVMMQLTHSALLQSFSLLPWVMVMAHRLAHRPTPRTAALFIFIASQQLFAGSPQPAFITFLFAISYYLFLVWREKRRAIRIVLFAGVYVGVLLLSAVQLLPSREFLAQTSVPGGNQSAQSTLYGFPVRHFLTFLNPFALGNPKFGTYYAQKNANESIFWENTGYIGILPLCFILLFLLIRRRHIGRTAVFWGLVLGNSTLLMMGKSSPLHVIYSFWPLTLFHVPSRFIWIVTFVLIIGSSATVSTLSGMIKNTKVVRFLLCAVILVQTSNLWFAWSGYHLYGNAREWLTTPKTAELLQPNGALHATGMDWAYYQQFIRGWQKSEPYLFLQQALPSNTSAIWGINHFDVIAGRNLWRPSVAHNILSKEIREESGIATISPTGTKFLRIFHIGNVVSPVPLDADGLQNPAKLSLNDGISLYLYQNPDPVPRAYMATATLEASTVERAKQILGSDAFIPGKTALLETKSPIQQPINGEGRVVIVEEGDTRMRLVVRNNPADSYVIIAATYYPGWQATVDGTPTPVYPANIMERAIPVPKGDHDVTLTYAPSSVRTGAILTGITLFVLVCLVVFPLPAAVVHTPETAAWIFRRPLNNHGR